MKKLILALFLLIVVSGCININIGKTAAEEKVSTSSEEQKGIPAKTEIKVSQMGMEMIISPSQDRVVKDIVTITVTKAPSNTGVIGFVIQGPRIEDLKKVGPNLGLDEDGSDGWSYDFDTNGYPNNKYTIAVIAFSGQPNEPPLGAAQAQVEIKNSEISPVSSPAIAPPYKVTGGTCKNPLQAIEDAKKLNANAISVGLFVGYMDNNGAAIWEPPEKAAQGCANLIALAHENSLAVMFWPAITNEEEMVIEDFHFDRETFIQTYKEMLKSYATFAQQNNVAIFIITTEVDTLAGFPTLQPEEQGRLAHDISKEFIKGVKEVYSGKIAIGLAGIEPDEPEASYYPFEGASIICFSSMSREGQVETGIQNIRKVAALMKKTGEMAGGINEVMLCEVYFLPKDVTVKAFASRERPSSFYRASFLQDEKEFFRRLISEAGPELSGIIFSQYSTPVIVRENSPEEAIAEEFGKWK